jgi:hypothetical protein
MSYRISKEEADRVAEISRNLEENADIEAALTNCIRTNLIAAGFVPMDWAMLRQARIPDRYHPLSFSRNGLIASHGWVVFVQSTGERLAELPDDDDTVIRFVKDVESMVHWPGWSGPITATLRDDILDVVEQRIADELLMGRNRLMQLEIWRQSFPGSRSQHCSLVPSPRPERARAAEPCIDRKAGGRHRGRNGGRRPTVLG